MMLPLAILFTLLNLTRGLGLIATDCPITCLNGAECMDLNGTSYYCRCSTGWRGRTCGRAVGCARTCQNGGYCVYMHGQGYKCQCRTGWTGNACEIDVDECLSSPCLSGGACINNKGSYYCVCSPGHTGKNCGTAVECPGIGTCQNGGQCINLNNTYMCDCSIEWSGKTCEIDVDECLTSPCSSYSTCVNTDGSYSCISPPKSTLQNLTIGNATATECPGIGICQHDGVCINLNSTYACDCTIGWSGNTCGIDVNECLTEPCFNGTCQNLLGSYKCV